jgi:hypothetical protein
MVSTGLRENLFHYPHHGGRHPAQQGQQGLVVQPPPPIHQLLQRIKALC